jgi:pimeloyl-ACP methyl ester carboxylesterase
MRLRLAYAFGVAVAAVAALVGTSLPAQAASAPLPIDWNWTAGFIPNLPNSATPPPGANDWNCKSTGTKRPLILVHGTWENQNDNWQAMSPFFKNAGYCVYTFNYGGNPGDVFWGWKGIADNAGDLAAFVDRVRARTGSAQVDLVGHSQGGMMPRYYIKFLGGQGKVRNFVGLAASNHGTTLSGIADLGRFLGLLPAVATIQPAAIDQTIGSAFMKKLDTCPGGAPNADICPGDPTKYTVIETNGDQIVTPYTNAFLKGATNIEVNKVCPLELAEHLGMTYSRNVAQLALKALDPTVTKNVCVVSLPYIGGGN